MAFARIAFLALLLAAPAWLPADEPLVGTEYYPLQVGATWHYRFTQGKTVTRVVKHEKIGEIQCAVLETKHNDKVVFRNHVALTKDGICLIGTDGKKAVPPVLQLPAAPTKDFAWEVDSNEEGTIHRGAYSVQSVDEPIEVPAGKYSTICVVGENVESGKASGKAKIHFAKGVGPVRVEFDFGTVTVKLELEKFEAGK